MEGPAWARERIGRLTGVGVGILAVCGVSALLLFVWAFVRTRTRTEGEVWVELGGWREEAERLRWPRVLW